MEDIDVDGSIILKSTLKKYNGRAAGFVWLRIGISDGLL